MLRSHTRTTTTQQYLQALKLAIVGEMVIYAMLIHIYLLILSSDIVCMICAFQKSLEMHLKVELD